MKTNFLQEQLASLGARLKALRLERGWTLEDLAGLSGLSKSYLSRLESRDRQASIAAVLTLSRLFDVSLASMFDEAEPEQIVIVRGGGTASYDVDGLTCWPLSARNFPLELQPMRVLVSPDRDGDERQCHDGEEWIYVISGELALLVGGQTHALSPGDAAHFDARVPHRMVALSGVEAEVLLVATPGKNPRASRAVHDLRFLS
jgi:transcriptional regulator with XRE-family HTH domain